MELLTHISVRNFSVTYGRHQAVRNISVEIPDKAITTIIGPSGCGKTTLLKSFNRLIDLQEDVEVRGTILVDGQDIYAPGTDMPSLRKKMGLLFQKPQVLPMTIYDNVAYGPRIHGLKNGRKLDETVERCLKEADLWEEVRGRLHGSASKLSAGQQQRLCLARGLAVEPEIILADEPTSALDPQSSRNIEERLRELKSRYTVVVVTHILRQARRLADYVIFLYSGELIEHGPAEKMFLAPEKDLTKEYMKGVIS